jgi:hypothetical protein
MNPTCLQMEPQLKARYSDYLAEYLHSGFKGKPWSELTRLSRTV